MRKNPLSVLILIIIFSLFIVFLPSSISQNSLDANSQTNEVLIPLNSIIISNNSDLLLKSLNYGWPGNGSLENQICICNEGILENKSLVISNTDLFINISHNNIVNNSLIILNSRFVSIANNYFENSTIRLSSIKDTDIVNNTFIDTTNLVNFQLPSFIEVSGSNNIKVVNNTIPNNFSEKTNIWYLGFSFFSSENLFIEGNNISSLDLYSRPLTVSNSRYVYIRENNFTKPSEMTLNTITIRESYFVYFQNNILVKTFINIDNVIDLFITGNILANCYSIQLNQVFQSEINNNVLNQTYILYRASEKFEISDNHFINVTTAIRYYDSQTLEIRNNQFSFVENPILNDVVEIQEFDLFLIIYFLIPFLFGCVFVILIASAYKMSKMTEF